MYDLIDRQAVLDFLTDEWDGDILHLFKGIKRIPPAPMEMHMDSHGITVRPAIAYGEAERREDGSD